MELQSYNPKVSKRYVLVVDYGSPYTDLITRKIRSLFIFSYSIIGPQYLIKAITSCEPKVIILSGGNNNVSCNYLPDEFLECVESRGIFVLGICYGMQLLVQELGGEVVKLVRDDDNNNKSTKDDEYCARMEIEVVSEKALVGLFGNKPKQVVWMNHHHEVVKLPQGFQVVARTKRWGSVAAIINKERKFYGLQYHPEVKETPDGMETLKYFLYEVCGLGALAVWKMEVVVNQLIAAMDKNVKPGNHVIYALSEGFNSTIAATLSHQAIGNRLHCVFVDHGLMSYKEKRDKNRLIETFQRDLHIPITCIDAREQFRNKLKDVTDPEKKRRIIKKEFYRTLRKFVYELEKNLGTKPTYFLQGILFPHFICRKEKTPDQRRTSRIYGRFIKDMGFEINKPLYLLYENEAIEIGRLLNVPKSILKCRQMDGSDDFNVWISDSFINDNKYSIIDTFRLQVNKITRRIYDSIRQISSGVSKSSL